MLDVAAPLAAIVREGSGERRRRAPRARASGVVMSPSGEQSTLGEGGAPSIELAEQGFYSVRMQGTGERRPFEVAVNLDPAESDLTPLEPTEFVATATGRAAVTATGQSLEHPDLTPEDMEKKQSFWWYPARGGRDRAARRGGARQSAVAKRVRAGQPLRRREYPARSIVSSRQRSTSWPKSTERRESSSGARQRHPEVRQPVADEAARSAAASSSSAGALLALVARLAAACRRRSSARRR